jgi:hypothetical protein
MEPGCREERDLDVLRPDEELDLGAPRDHSTSPAIDEAVDDPEVAGA